MIDAPRNCVLNEIEDIIFSVNSEAFCLKRPIVSIEFDGDIDYLCSEYRAVELEVAITNHLQSRGLAYKIVSHVSNRKFLSKKFVICCGQDCIFPLQVDINYSIHWLFFDIISIADKSPEVSEIGNELLYKKVKAAKNFLYKSNLGEIRDVNSLPKQYLDYLGKDRVQLCHKLKFAINNLKFSFQNVFFFTLNSFKILRKNSLESMVLAFYGPDGVGKSSLIQGVKDSSRVNVLYDDIIVCHTRPAIIPSISSLFKGIRRNKLKFRPPRSVENMSSWKCYVLFSYYFVDYFLFKLKMYVPFKRRKQLYIFDRYFLDYLYQQTFKNLPNSLVLSCHKLIATNTLEIFVGGDPDIIEKRKNELTSDQVRYQIEVFKEAVEELEDIKKIDNTGRPLEENIEIIEKLVWNK